ncbi:MAG: hypothetical protein ABSH06_14640 [Thermodesulfobacteriota bacterium]
MKKRIQSSEVIILGAGASANFRPASYPFDKTLIPFPMAEDFFQRAIEYGVLKERNFLGQPMHRPLLDFIEKSFHLSFEGLKVNKLSIEKVYAELDKFIIQIDESKNLSNKEVDLYLAKIDLTKLIEELLGKLSRHYGGCEYHAILAGHVVENESVVISFNWDTLIDGALYNTKRWFYETGYGIEFKRVYFNKEEILDEKKESKGLLLKPHGSINWFRYQDLYWSDRDGFTGEPVSDEEAAGTYLFEFVRTKPPRTHPAHMRLYLGKDFKPPLKKPAEINIIPPIPPGQKSTLEERPAFKTIWNRTHLVIKNAKRIIAIGYALKEPSIRLRFKKFRRESNKPLLLTLVNKCAIDPEFVKHYREIFNPDKIDLFHSFEEFCNAIRL